MGRHDDKTRRTGSPKATAESFSPVALLAPYATVFASSCCVMVIELVAGRIIARHLGSSLYTWTSVIGIVLAGLAIGNYIGGRLADRFPVKRTLAALFLAASAASVSISLFNNLAGDLRFLWTLPWQARVASHVALVFFLPACLLGMISPVVAKMALDVGYKTGRTLGNVYAWGVVGSIIGTFATGFFLVAWFGTTSIIMGVAGVLALMAILYRTRSWKTWSWMAVVVLFGALTTSSAEAARTWGERLALRKPPRGNVLYSKESQYSYIQVIQLGDDPNTREMHLDALLHSRIDMEHPTDLRYAYEKIFAAVTTRLHPHGRRVDSLMVGGGGYVFPRYMEAAYPGSRTDVAEIDPEVTKAAMIAFGLPEKTPIHVYHEDARVLVDRLVKQKRDGDSAGLYDAIYMDAFQHYNVPFQLTTLEFTTNVRELLKTDGVYLVNLIDAFEDGLFLGAVVNTLQEVFTYVYVLVEGTPVRLSREDRNTFVVVGMNRPLDTTNLGAEYRGDCRIFSLTHEESAKLAAKSNQLILTDEYAPVEILLASVVRTHATDKAFGDWFRNIRLAVSERGYDQAIALARDALDIFPDDPRLLMELGGALRYGGEVRAARAEFQKVFRLHPDHVRARLGLIDCYRDLGQLEESLDLFPAVLDYDPIVRFNYGTTLAKLGRYREAVEQFKRVSELRPDFAGAYNNCGNALYGLGDINGAIEQFKLALEYEPNHPDAGPNLARLLDSTRRKE